MRPNKLECLSQQHFTRNYEIQLKGIAGKTSWTTADKKVMSQNPLPKWNLLFLLLPLPENIRLEWKVLRESSLAYFYNKTSFLVQIKFITEDSKWFIYKY
jgi:hypothetical protein